MRSAADILINDRLPKTALIPVVDLAAALNRSVDWVKARMDDDTFKFIRMGERSYQVTRESVVAYLLHPDRTKR